MKNVTAIPYVLADVALAVVVACSVAAAVLVVTGPSMPVVPELLGRCLAAVDVAEDLAVGWCIKS